YRVELGTLTVREDHRLTTTVLQRVVCEYHLREINPFALASEVEEREQSAEEDRPLLDIGIAVVKDLREESVEPDVRCHVRLEEAERPHLALSGLQRLRIPFLTRRLGRIPGRVVTLDEAILHRRESRYEFALSCP